MELFIADAARHRPSDLRPTVKEQERDDRFAEAAAPLHLRPRLQNGWGQHPSRAHAFYVARRLPINALNSEGYLHRDGPRR
jgi:hypothetical protein